MKFHFIECQKRKEKVACLKFFACAVCVLFFCIFIAEQRVMLTKMKEYILVNGFKVMSSFSQRPYLTTLSCLVVVGNLGCWPVNTAPYWPLDIKTGHQRTNDHVSWPQLSVHPVHSKREAAAPVMSSQSG